MNPWEDLPTDAPFVLPSDREAVTEYQGRVRKPEHRLALDTLPEPWVGNPHTATVVVLQLNPGYKPEEDDPLHARADYLEVVRRSLTHQPLDIPFHYLDPRFTESGGAGWCRRRNHWAVDRLGAHMVGSHLAQLEWFPYRSTRAGRLPGLPSQHYSVELLREALDRRAVVIATRKIVEWEKAVPELVRYPLRLGTASVQNLALSPGNLTIGGRKTPEAFKLFIDALVGRHIACWNASSMPD
jgi:hypothetical protein